MMSTAARACTPSPRLPEPLATSLICSLPEPILVVDCELHITFANPSFCDWIGVAWHEVEGRSLESVLGSNAQVISLLKGTPPDSGFRDVQVHCSIPGLGKRELLLTGNSLRGTPRPSMSIEILDITVRNLRSRALKARAEAARLNEEQRQRRESALLRSVLESSGDGIGACDPEGGCVLWNRACEEMMGPQHIGVRFDEWSEHSSFFLPDKQTPCSPGYWPLKRSLDGEVCDNVELWVSRAGLSGIWVSITSRPLSGGHDGAVATFRDITFAKQATAALAAQSEEVARSNRELEQFASVAAHDLQEPLRMVYSYVQLLSRRYQGKLDNEADEFIAFATEGAARMSRLINDLLTYSRIGRGDVTERQVDCEKVLKQVLESLSPKILAAGVEVTHDPLPQITANEIQIMQVFQNLIDNAVKFRSKQAPRVHISAGFEDNKWIFSVADNGIGIEEQYKERVFVIFQRLNSREQYDGTGIGLAVCKKIIEKHEGKIWVTPNEGSGTVVNFTWP